MKLVSSSKFAKANKVYLQAQRYNQALTTMVAKFLVNEQEVSAKLLEARQEKTVCLVVCSTDRGLCGNLNAVILKKALSFIQEKKKQDIAVKVFLWGKKGFFLSRFLSETPLEEELSVFIKPSIKKARFLADNLLAGFSKEDYDSVSFVYPRFKNILTQTPTIKKIVPLTKQSTKTPELDLEPLHSFKLEPKKGILDRLLNIKLVNDIYQVLLNGSAAEHAARMTAMDNATRNADEVIKALTLEYNRARQAAITKELIEITSGAEAL